MLACRYCKLLERGYCYQAVQRWTRRMDVFACGLLLLPIHLPAHWSLVAVNVQVM